MPSSGPHSSTAFSGSSRLTLCASRALLPSAARKKAKRVSGAASNLTACHERAADLTRFRSGLRPDVGGGGCGGAGLPRLGCGRSVVGLDLWNDLRLSRPVVV